MELFRDLSTRAMKEVVPLFELEQHEAGVRIFGEGEPGNKVYIMLHGIVVVCKGSLELATLDAAASDENVMFGEMAILDRKPRMAAVYSKTVRCPATTHEQQPSPSFGHHSRAAALTLARTLVWTLVRTLVRTLVLNLPLAPCGQSAPTAVRTPHTLHPLRRSGRRASC